ncbi:MAG: hypothetical protein LH616_04920, partial [Ilumatobacteraceae bacterium]|nr:hypothetical protein [Ilumatobacteraceae bacterium]
QGRPGDQSLLRLVSGHYRGLGVMTGSELYLIARGADDETGKFFAMRYADPHPCELPGVGRFSATRDPSRSAPLLAYFHDDSHQGTLHFANAECKAYPFTLEDARLPLGETEQGVVVWAGTDLWLATPETGKQKLLADGVEDVIRGVFGKRNAVRANGRLTVFDASWKAQGTFGQEVGSVLRAGQSLFYLDAAGAHRIVANDADSNVVEDELLASDACMLGSQDGTWVAFRSPCSDGKVLAIHEPTGRTFTLPFDADPRQLKLVPALKSRGRDPLVDPFWFFYLRSGDDDSSKNTLFVRTPAGAELALGAHSTLLQLRLVESARETHGYALVDVDGETGRYVWWNAAGETRVLAEGAMWRPQRLIVDFDGTVGKLAVASGERLLVLANSVPWQAFEYQDDTREWTVLFHDMQAGVGRLSVFPAGLDALQAVPPDKPFTAPELTEMASNVIVFGTSSLNDVLSGVSYLTNFDPTTRTGRLEYRNLELRFTATVKSGVSDYVVSHDEVLYTVPYGADAGIWLVPGK